VRTTDGHNFDEMERAFRDLPHIEGRPSAVIASTVRGKGLPSIERRADRWFVNFTREEVEQLLAELRTGVTSSLTSETLMVR
jgi:transketolase